MKNLLDQKLITALAPGGIFRFNIKDEKRHEIMVLGENWIKESEIQILIKKYMLENNVSSICQEDKELWCDPAKILC